jgi:hypothetical protein
MRYLYYIIIILLVLSAAIGYEVIPRRISAKNAALIINDQVITTDEFTRLYSSRSSNIKDESDFTNTLITRELLIQESQKEGIDKEESFRSSIQNFYEQSLIKLLLDRKFSSLQISISEEELKSYISLLKSNLLLTIFSFDDLAAAQKNEYRDGESKTINFEDLSKEIRSSVTALKKGQMTGPIKMGDKYVVIRLDRIENAESGATPVSAGEKDRITKMLIEEKKEKIINNWVTDLREKASIRILLHRGN